MKFYVCLTDCWGEIQMSTIIKMGGSYWLDQSREQHGLELTDCTTLVKGIMDGKYYADEYLEYVGKI